MRSTAKVRDEVRRLAGAFDAALVTAADAAAIVADCGEIERLAAGMRMAAAARVADTSVWRAKGHRSPADWLAATSQSSVGEAAGMLATGKRLADLPATAAAVRSGKLTPAQAGEVSAAAVLAPEAEAQLLVTAGRSSFKGLREQAQKVRAAATDHDRARRDAVIHAGRYLRTKIDDEGAFCLAMRGRAADGARLVELMKPYQEQVFRAGRKAGTRETFEARAFDSMLALAEGAHRAPAASPEGASDGAAADAGRRKTGRGSSLPGGTNTKVIVRIDHAALVRGHAVAGETVEIAGLGPVSVDCVKELMKDAFLAAVVTKGVDVVNVAHLGRHFTVHQETALAATVAQACTNIACNQTVALQIDHRDPWGRGGPTKVDNGDILCPHDHYLKTHHGYHLEPGPGRRRLLPPGSDEPDSGPDPPPPKPSTSPNPPATAAANPSDPPGPDAPTLPL